MVFTVKQEDQDFIPDEPMAKKIKSKGSPFKSISLSSGPISIKNEQPEPFVPSETSVIMTEATTDENIFPDATYQTYEEFEQKFNTWKAKYLHPFRVASSETLRTEDGSVSEKFKYRYVVYHCARYGAPRKRGEGKRPNQNYLPCSCTAMIRLNFNFHEQCLKLTSLETRHSNHKLDKELYDKMQMKEEKRKHATPRRRTTGVSTKESVQNNKKPASDDNESKHTASYSPSPVNFDSSQTLNQRVPSMTTDFNLVSQNLQVSRIPAIPAQKVEIIPSLATNFQALQDIQKFQNPMVINQWNVFPNTSYPSFGTSVWNSNPTSAPSQSTSESSVQISPISSTVDENEAPQTFHSMETVRPIALRPSENSAFHQMIHSRASTQISPYPKSEIDSILASASRMLHDVNLPSDVLLNRMKQLNHLISQWSQ